MKQLFTLVLAAMAFVACTQNDVEELSANRADVPETLTVGFEGGDTRIELNEAVKTVWTEGDEVSVFYRSYENMCWAFQGETGDRSGELKLVSGNVGDQTMDNTIVVYPYNENYKINLSEGGVEASLPAVQSYQEGSYGKEGNIMVAESTFTQFVLKSVVGWLRVELTGEGEVVESITVRGNGDEQLAGLCYIDAADASISLAESEVDESLVATEVVLNCGDGVTLGAEATEFYVALLPQEFAKGITIEVLFNDGSALTKSVDYLLLERNHIAPVALGESKWQVIGEGLYRDDFIGPLYGVPAGTISSVEVAQHIEDKNRYRIIEPYSRDAVTAILGGTPSDMIFTTPGYVEFIVDPTAGTAYIPSSWLGFKLDVGTGNGPEDFYLASVYADKTTPVYGKYEVDTGMISFPQPQSIMWHIPDGRGNYTNFSGLFAVALKAVTNTWSVVGSFNNWGEAPEIDMTYDEANNIFYATGVEFAADTEFKLRNNWNDSYGSSFYSYIDANSFKTALSDGENIRVKDAGTYDIYFSEDDLLIWLMESGKDRATAVGDFPDGWDGETTSEIRYTSNDDNIISPGDITAFDLEILSNEYVNGEGVITFAGELTTIGSSAFENCDSLTSVTIPDSVTTIGDWAFYDCDSLTSVTIPDSVTTIGDYAFNWCPSLTSITIPDSVTTIGDWAFSGCTSLTSVTIGDSVTTIGGGAFASCHSLAEFKGKFAADGGRCLIKDNTIIAYANASGTTYTIPDSVTTIGFWAFRGCDSLTSVTIPDSVTTIGNNAFYYCSSLTSVTIPDSVTTIGFNAFFLCSSLTSVTIGDSVTTIGDYAFSRCDSLTSVYCEATTPPSLGDVAFKYYVNGYVNIGCPIYVPAESVGAYKAASGWSEYASYIVGYNFETGEEVAISNKLFYTATALVEPYDASAFNVTIVSNEWDETTGEGVITFDGELTTIGYAAFEYCTSLTSVTIPDSVTTIGRYAFFSCHGLTSVTIPDSVTAIGYMAFYWCTSLTSVTIPDSVTTIGEAAFASCKSLTEFKGKFAADGGRCLIKENTLIAYANASGTTYTIPDSVTTIGRNAFENCGLTSVTIPDSVTTIGDYAFNGCSSLTRVTIPDSVTTIGEAAFCYCSITSITIPDSVMTIGDGVFADCSDLAEFKGKFAADGGRCLIKDNTLIAYAYASGITYTIPDSVTTIGRSAFSDCDSLTSVTIPDGVTTIGDWAFTYCSNLTSVTIGNSVTTIGDMAFYYCSSLTSVYCKAITPPMLGGSSVFYGHKSGRKIYVPAESVEAYKAAEYWSEYAENIVGYDFE